MPSPLMLARGTILRLKRLVSRGAVGRSRHAAGVRLANGDIRTALAAMPLFVREAYLLRQVDHLNYRQISRALGISQKEVQRLLRDAVEILDRCTTGRPADP